MAARFWRWVLAGELAAAAMGAWLVAWAMSSPLAVAVVLVPIVFLALQVFVVASSQVLGRVLSRATPAPLRVLQALRVCVSEVPSFALAKLAMSVEPWRSSPDQAPAGGSGAGRPVLLVHGVLCNRAVWGPLYRRLRAAGFGPIRAINLEPLDADIDAFANQMAREVAALRSEASDRRVAVVAHSMGGLVARAAMRRGAAGAISHLVTLATPHHGSVLARFVPGPAGAQLLPTSPWLQALNATADHSSVQVTSIFSEDDNQLFPARSAVLKGAELHAVQGVGHFGLLRSRRALDHVLAVLLPANAQAGRAT